MHDMKPTKDNILQRAENSILSDTSKIRIMSENQNPGNLGGSYLYV